MPRPFALVLIVLVAAAAAALAQETFPPVPRKLPDAADGKSHEGKVESKPLEILPFEDDPPPLNLLAEMKRKLEQLKAERLGLTEDGRDLPHLLDDPTPVETDLNAKLRLRIGSLLTEMSTRRFSRPTVAIAKDDGKAPAKGVEKKETPPPPRKLEVDPGEDKAPLDSLALAHALFRSGDYGAALKSYQRVPLKGLLAEERAPIQYLTAACLCQTGKTDEALGILHDLVNNSSDEQLVECAQWQIKNINWRRDLTAKLKSIQARRLALEKSP